MSLRALDDGQPDLSTVADILDWYVASNPDPSSCAAAEAERSRNRQEFGRAYGHQHLSACKPYVLLGFVMARTSLRSAWSRRRWASAIARPFNLAEQLGLISRNPFRGLRWPDGQAGRDWTDDEYRAMLRQSPAEVRRLLIFLRFSGARPGEARSLTQRAIQLQTRVVCLAEHKTARSTGKPRRIVLNRVLVKLLTWLIRHNPPAEHLFLNSFARPWSRAALNKRLREIRRKAGLAESVKLHGLRHTFACHAIMNGVDVATLAELLGHTRITTTQRYLHLAGKCDHLAAAMEKAVKM